MTRTIAVGLGGASGAQALTWACTEAEETGARLMMLHACPSRSPLAAFTGEPPANRVELADPVLAHAVAATGTRLSGRRVLRILVGDPATTLTGAAVRADLPVIGAGHDDDIARRIMRQAPCPVVVARPSLDAPEAPFADHVVVAVDGGPSGRAALEFAFECAEEHHLPIAAAHVSPDGRDDVLSEDTTRYTRTAVEPSARTLLGAEVEPWRTRYPHVPVRRAIFGGAVADGLVRAAAGARLLVVGDKSRDVRAPMRTRDIPSALAHAAGCPVVTVPVDGRGKER